MFGLLLIFGAQVAYAVGGLLIRKYFLATNPLLVSAMMAVVSGLVFLPMAVYFRPVVADWPSKSIVLLVVVGLLWSVIAEVLYVVGFQRAPSLTTASLMTLFYPLLSTILAVWVLKEPLTAKTIVAAILMMGGFVLLAM